MILISIIWIWITTKTIFDDTVLLEDETEIDPIAEGIKPKEDGEEEY